MTIRLLFVAAALLASSSAYTADFHLIADKCKALAGALDLRDDALKVVDADPTVASCTRQSKRILCEIQHKDGTKSAGKYKVVLDSPPLLHFQEEGGADFYAVNLTEHAGVFITRMVVEKMLASKVCHSFFATDQEMQAMKQKKDK